MYTVFETFLCGGMGCFVFLAFGTDSNLYKFWAHVSLFLILFVTIFDFKYAFSLPPKDVLKFLKQGALPPKKKFGTNFIKIELKFFLLI